MSFPLFMLLFIVIVDLVLWLFLCLPFLIRLMRLWFIQFLRVICSFLLCHFNVFFIWWKEKDEKIKGSIRSWIYTDIQGKSDDQRLTRKIGHSCLKPSNSHNSCLSEKKPATEKTTQNSNVHVDISIYQSEYKLEIYSEETYLIIKSYFF